MIKFSLFDRTIELLYGIFRNVLMRKENLKSGV